MTASDLNLLRQYAQHHAEDAFAEIVRRHLNLVYSAALRQVRSPQLAEEVAQSVFTDLARNAGKLKPDTILTAWLYQVTRRTAIDVVRREARRQLREHIATEMNTMNATTPDWTNIEPLLDEAMHALDDTDRTAVLLRYFENKSLREVGATLGTSDDAAQKRVSRAVEHLREIFAKHGITIGTSGLVVVISANAVQAAPVGLAVTISTAAAVTGTAITTTATAAATKAIAMTTLQKTLIVAAAGGLLITSGTVRYFTRENVQTAQPNPEAPPATRVGRANTSQSTPDDAGALAPRSRQTLGPLPIPGTAQAPPTHSEVALKTARETSQIFQQRIAQFALMTDPLKVQELLLSEYGIRLSVDEIRTLQERGQKGFSFGVIDLWASKQPLEALTWAASALADPNRGGVDFHQLFLNAARTSLPDLNHDALAKMLPEGPGKARMLDLAEASTDPASLANRILTVTDPVERASRLKVLAQGWSDPETSVEWARQNLSGEDKTAFYSQVGYNLAHQNPQSAFEVLAELKGTDVYAFTFASMMRGLVQEGGQGQQAAELIANSDLNPPQRADLISELARRWVRNDPDAAVAWVNHLTAPGDFRAAIPLLVSQLDHDRVSRTVDAYLKNLDPVMELALIEAAAPPGLAFDPDKSRLILDPLINKDSEIKLTSAEGNGSSKEELLWSSVNQTAKRQAEAGQPAAAIEWLAKLPFANQSDYSKAIANVLTSWNLKSPSEAAGWLQNTALDPKVKADVLKAVGPGSR